MKKIVLVKPMTIKETKDRINFFKGVNKSNNERKKKILNDNEDRILSSYWDLDHKYKEAQREDSVIFYKRLNARENKTCMCGSDIRYISSHNFWGCIDYRNDDVRHEVFEGRDDFDIVSFDTCRAGNFLTEVLEEVNIRGKVNAKMLLDFILDHGLEDLKMKYNDLDSYESIDTRQNSKKAQDIFEEKIYQEVKGNYDYCYKQFGIKFKYEGSDKYEYRFLDIIGSKDDRVDIIECKTSRVDMNEQQKQLYLYLFRFIEKNGKRRKVNFEYRFAKNK